MTRIGSNLFMLNLILVTLLLLAAESEASFIGANPVPPPTLLPISYMATRGIRLSCELSYNQIVYPGL